VPEALASGLAVLSFDKAAASELIVSGKNGCLVDEGDDLAFISAAVNLAADVALRHTLCAAAAPSVAHLSWDSIYETFLRTLGQVLHSHGGAFSAPQWGSAATSLSHPVQQALPHSHARTLL
jgi:glycosyltransferase involved in cell wall biosynthesis